MFEVKTFLVPLQRATHDHLTESFVTNKLLGQFCHSYEGLVGLPDVAKLDSHTRLTVGLIHRNIVWYHGASRYGLDDSGFLADHMF